MDEPSKLLVRNIPQRLKGKIARAVRDSGRSMNDVLVEILAAKYGVEFTPSGRKAGSREVGASGTIMLYMPSELRDAIDLDAQASGESVRNTVAKVLSERFGVPYTATGRWVGVRKRAKRPRSRTR